MRARRRQGKRGRDRTQLLKKRNHKQNTNKTQTKIKKKIPVKDREVDEIEDEECGR